MMSRIISYVSRYKPALFAEQHALPHSIFHLHQTPFTPSPCLFFPISSAFWGEGGRFTYPSPPVHFLLCVLFAVYKRLKKGETKVKGEGSP